MVQMLGTGVAHLPTGTYNRYPGMGDGCRHPIDLHAGLLHITTIFGRYSVRCPLVFGSGGPDVGRRVSVSLVADVHVPIACSVLSWYSSKLYTWKSILGYISPSRH